MAPSNFTPNERLLRKRLAARLRQRRCRERKREMIMAGVVGPKAANVVTTNKSDSSVSLEGTPSGDNSTVYSSAKSTPASSPSKTEPVYVNVQNSRPPPQGAYGWSYPVMPSIPRGRTSVPTSYHHPPHPPPSASNGYYPPPSSHYHQAPMVHVMYPHHHQYMPHPAGSHYYPPPKGGGHFGPPPYPGSAYGPPPSFHPSAAHQPAGKVCEPYRPTSEADPGDVSRTVSRSPSDASMHSGKAAELAAEKEKIEQNAILKEEVSYQENSVNNALLATGVVSAEEMGGNVTMKTNKKKQKASHKSRNNQKSLMSTEKAAISAMLAMKSSSDESDGDSISTGTNKSMSGPNEESRSTVTIKHQNALVASV